MLNNDFAIRSIECIKCPLEIRHVMERVLSSGHRNVLGAEKTEEYVNAYTKDIHEAMKAMHVEGHILVTCTHVASLVTDLWTITAKGVVCNTAKA